MKFISENRLVIGFVVYEISNHYLGPVLPCDHYNPSTVQYMLSKMKKLHFTGVWGLICCTNVTKTLNQDGGAPAINPDHAKRLRVENPIFDLHKVMEDQAWKVYMGNFVVSFIIFDYFFSFNLYKL